MVGRGKWRFVWSGALLVQLAGLPWCAWCASPARGTLVISPSSASVRAGQTRKFYAQAGGGMGPAIVWRVNGVKHGTVATGTITADGTYTAPAAVPAKTPIEIEAVSVATPSLSGKALVTILNPIPVVAGVKPPQFTYGPQTLTVTGTGFVPSSQIKVGNEVLTTKLAGPTELTAEARIAPAEGGLVAVTVVNPDPGGSTTDPKAISVGPLHPQMSSLAAARFLEQASWGPNPASVAHLQEIGFERWLDEQFRAPPTLYKPSTTTAEDLTEQQGEFFIHATTGADQLRQRVAFALGQIFVVSGLKTSQPRQMVPYQNMLLQDAFGTYSRLLRDVTLSPTMGVYLDMVNNDKANSTEGTSPNENYARELMQLFTIGTVGLKPDGTETGEVTYDQHTITDMARALTGWTFPGKALSEGHNPENFEGPMIAVEANHDEGKKTVVAGLTLPGGQSSEQDLHDVLHALSTHPNTAPFISERLIQHLVTSDPGPDYLRHVSEVFTSSGGDLKAVVRQILLDPEARRGDDPGAAPEAGAGHWREPVLAVLAMMRNLDATARTDNRLERFPDSLGQRVFYATSVFNDYSPLYRTSKGLLAPEFELLSSGTALMRANVVRRLLEDRLGGDALFDLSPFVAFAGSPGALVDAVDNAFLAGRLPGPVKQEIVAAISVTHDYNLRVRNAIYLVASSALYQVQH
jgi:uncharacterized protein (DUF1800 family)